MLIEIIQGAIKTTDAYAPSISVMPISLALAFAFVSKLPRYFKHTPKKISSCWSNLVTKGFAFPSFEKTNQTAFCFSDLYSYFWTNHWPHHKGFFSSRIVLTIVWVEKREKTIIIECGCIDNHDSVLVTLFSQYLQMSTHISRSISIYWMSGWMNAAVSYFGSNLVSEDSYFHFWPRVAGFFALYSMSFAPCSSFCHWNWRTDFWGGCFAENVVPHQWERLHIQRIRPLLLGLLLEDGATSPQKPILFIFIW